MARLGSLSELGMNVIGSDYEKVLQAMVVSMEAQEHLQFLLSH